MGVNILIKEFEDELVNLFNNSGLPIGIKRSIYYNVLHSIDKANEQAIQNELIDEAAANADQELKEETE